jgi:hypothetical protein
LHLDFEPIRDNEDKEPQSPDLVNLTNYEEFLRRTLPRFVRNALETQVNNEIQPIEERLRGQLMDVIEQAQNRAFQEYRGMMEESHSTDPSVDSGYASNHARPTSTSSHDRKGKGLGSNMPAETSITSMAGPETLSDFPEVLTFPSLEEDANFGSKSTGHLQQSFPPMSSSEHFHETMSSDFLPSEAFFSNDLLQSHDQSAPNMMDLDSVEWAHLVEEDSNSK